MPPRFCRAEMEATLKSRDHRLPNVMKTCSQGTETDARVDQRIRRCVGSVASFRTPVFRREGTSWTRRAPSRRRESQSLPQAPKYAAARGMVCVGRSGSIAAATMRPRMTSPVHLSRSRSHRSAVAIRRKTARRAHTTGPAHPWRSLVGWCEFATVCHDR